MLGKPRVLLSLLFLFSLSAYVAASPPIADVHLHYKWSQTDVTRPQDAINTLAQHGVALAVVTGTPAELALRLAELAPDKIIPIWSPYRVGGDWSRWAFDTTTLERARTALEGGQYKGIGELHLIGGFAPKPRSPVLKGIMQLAAEHDVPVLLHTEFSSEQYLIDLCSNHRKTRILWAHAGAILSADKVDAALRTCPNVWAELSARDPWRFIHNPITGNDGLLLPEWKTLIQRWPQRFMIGSDPVWPVDRMDSWDQADTGWVEYARFMAFHQHWLRALDNDLAEALRFDNAQRFFRPN